MATAGNVALWHQLASLPELNNRLGVAFAIGVSALVAVTLALENTIKTPRSGSSIAGQRSMRWASWLPSLFNGTINHPAHREDARVEALDVLSQRHA